MASNCALKVKNNIVKEVEIAAPIIASKFVSTANVGTVADNAIEVRFQSREVGDSQQYPLQAANELTRQLLSAYPELSEKQISIKNSSIKNANIFKVVIPDKIAEKIVDRLQEQKDIVDEATIKDVQKDDRFAPEIKETLQYKQEQILSPEMEQIIKNNHPQAQDGMTQLELDFLNQRKDKNCN